MKRVLSLLLSVLFVFSVMPINAYAESVSGSEFDNSLIDMLSQYNDENFYSQIVVDVENNTMSVDGSEDIDLKQEYDIDYSSVDSLEYVIPAVPVLNAAGYDATLDKNTGEVTVDGEDVSGTYSFDGELKENDEVISTENGVQTVETENGVENRNVGYFDEEQAEEFNFESEYNDGKIIITNPYQSKRIVVQTKNSTALKNTYDAVKMINDSKGYYVLQFDSQNDAKDAIAKIKALKNVEYAVCDEVVKVTAISDRAGAKTIQSDRYKTYLKNNNKATAVKVAVLDTGTTVNHPLLKNRLLTGYNVYTKKSDVTDVYGHGTHVSGIVADNTPSNVKILPIKVLNDNGSGTDLAIKAGIDYAVKQKVKVINMSLGGSCAGAECPINKAVKAAVKAGVTVVVAAGNDTMDTQQLCPAGISECITVSSSNADGSSISTYSNYGSAVDVTAPGENILSASTDGGYIYSSGTSMASPFAAATVAMIITNTPTIKPAQVEEKLKSYCADMLIKGWDKYSGSGIINLGIPLGDTETSNYLNISVGDLRLKYFSKCSPYLTTTIVSLSGNSADKPVIDRSVTATSTDKNVAYFDGRYIIPKGEGKCTITISLPNGKSSSSEVTVEKKEVWIDYASSSYAGGNGTKSSPYQIKTASQLAKFAKDVRNGKTFKGKYLKLMNDIDLSGKLWITASCYTSNSSYLNGVSLSKEYFRGNFDGGNHKIKNMHVFDEELRSEWGEQSPINGNWYKDNTGFIGDALGAVIKNLGIDNAYCSSEDGGLLLKSVYSTTTISNCYTSGFTRGCGLVGNFCNYSNKMTNSYSSATVGTSGIAVNLCSSKADGGVILNNVFFCGELIGSERQYSTASFTESVESYKGYSNTKLYNCFSTAKSQNGAGFATNQLYSKISKCYYSEKNTKGINKNTGGTVDLKAKSDKFFKTKSSYTTSSNWNTSYKWDFTNTWSISSSINNGYPYLKKNKPTNNKPALNTGTWLDFYSSSYAGGNGTSSDPYLISTPQQLARISYVYRYGGGKGVYFKLINDIDLSAHEWYPIGAGNNMDACSTDAFSDTPHFYNFMGCINGNGHTITGLNIDSTGDCTGLIAKQYRGYVKNINFKDVNIKGGEYTGAVSADMSGYAVIFNCSVSGTVSARQIVGGFAGKLSGTSRIIGSSSTDVILSAASKIGGIVGECYGLVEKCSYINNLSKPNRHNLISGDLKGIIKNCYGYEPNGNNILTYTSGGEIINSYAYTKDSKLYKNCLHGQNIQSVTDSQLTDKSTYSGFDFNNIWTINEDVNGGLPILRKVSGYSVITAPSEKWKAATSFAGGDGSKKNPYLIASASQLALLRDKYYNYNGKYFRIIRNINLDKKYWSGSCDSLIDIVKVYIDGNNKTVSNLIGKDGAALFPFCLEKGGYIKNLTVKNVKGKISAGLCVTNMGTISNCSVSGEFSAPFYSDVTCLSDVGGICISNHGTISKCSVNATINGDICNGGITAINCGKIQNCYVKGTMINGDALADRNYYYSNGIIKNCYSVAKQIANYFTTSSESESLINLHYLGEGTGITLSSNLNTMEEMKNKNTYSGWDFDTVWQISPSVNNGYPTLILPKSQKITYVLNGGTATSRMENDYIPGVERTLQSPTYKYGVFQGWYRDKAFKKKATTIGANDTKDITLYAKWKPAYRVTFNANGGKGTTKDQTIATGTSTALRANGFKRNGYVFVGWAKSKNGKVVYKNKAKVKNLTSSKKTVTLYAKWKKK